MIRKLRRKFTLVSMLSLLVVLTVILGGIMAIAITKWEAGHEKYT